MPEHPNAAHARQAWEAVSRGDADGLRELWDEKLVWHATGRGPWTGDHRGLDTILDFLARVGETTDRFDATLVDVLASDQRVAVLFRAVLGSGARRTAIDYLLVSRIENGKTVEIWTTPLNPREFEAFWADSSRDGAQL